jgi:Membrane proteins related to metalloendopeptidases
MGDRGGIGSPLSFRPVKAKGAKASILALQDQEKIGHRSPRPSRLSHRERPQLKLPRIDLDLSFAKRGVQAIRTRLSTLPRGKLVLFSALACSALAAAGIAAFFIARGPAFPMPSSGLTVSTDSAQDLLLDYVAPELNDGNGGDAAESSAPPPAPVTLEYTTYTVRPGDSLASIAKRFGLYIDTLISANGISTISSVKSGRELKIPNINGLIYKVRSGDSLSAISSRYKTDTTRIVDANDLGSSTLAVGQSIFIPGARLPEVSIRQAMGQLVAWPARGPLSSYFGYRPDPFTGVRRFHAGIDIVVDQGTPVKAAMDGVVADVGYNANYGNYIILTHADGFQTLYGHLSQQLAAQGARVQQGKVIGLSGNTGYSTGPHLHFGLFKRSAAQNPLKYLK